MAPPVDPNAFPIREGSTVPRDMVTPYAASLTRSHGDTIAVLAARGGISVYEVLLLQPPPPGVEKSTHMRDITNLTLTEAMAALRQLTAEFYKKREADAEAAMLAAMEAEAAAAEAEPLA